MSRAQNSTRAPDRASTAEWRRLVEKCQQPSAPRALWQLVNTLVPYALLWYLMYRMLEVSLWLTIPLAVLAGAFLVRVFIIFHDCGHGSYFKSGRANDIVGFLAGACSHRQWHHSRRTDSHQRVLCDVGDQLLRVAPRQGGRRCQSPAEVSGMTTRNANCMAATHRSARKPAR
jgi:fatty acid desaturase